MSSPKVLVQIFITGSRILGKAFFEAGRQAVKNAKNSPAAAAMGNDAAGVGHANSGSPTDQLTRRHRMTLDEAQLILNVKKGDEIEKILKNYEYLFKTNSPPPPPEKPVSGKQSLQFHSHYLQSKVFCARERLEAELNFREALTESPAAETKGSSPPTPDPHQSTNP